VFRRLMALNQCVILFDEIEEFALDRETPGLSMESRMLTTGTSGDIGASLCVDTF